MDSNAELLIRSRIRDIPDYPRKGIVFKDLTPLFKDKHAFAICMGGLSGLFQEKPDYIVGIESRGFIIGSALAYALGVGFVPVRKEGKLPYDRIGRKYELEYGSATLEMHRDAIERGSSVAIVDDLLATGGTANAAAELVEELGGKISTFAFVVELTYLDGRKRLNGRHVDSLIRY